MRNELKENYRSLREIEKEVSQAQTWPDVFRLMNELIDKARGLKEERDRLQREVSQLEQELAISEELD
jgi:hypothetical protein